jgi:hypothetical protein
MVSAEACGWTYGGGAKQPGGGPGTTLPMAVAKAGRQEEGDATLLKGRVVAI